MVREASAELAVYADCTETQMMAMFGRTDLKMPAHDVALANREKLGMSGTDKIVSFDQSQSLAIAWRGPMRIELQPQSRTKQNFPPEPTDKHAVISIN